MKRLYLPVQATTPVPMEAFYRMMGLPDPPPLPQPPPPITKPTIKIVKAKPVPPLTRQQRYQQDPALKAYTFYDGKLPFKDWLRSTDATVEKVSHIDLLLTRYGIAGISYISSLCPEARAITRGEMLSRIRFMEMEIVTREMLTKFKTHTFLGMVDFYDYEDRIRLILQLGSRTSQTDSPFFVLMEQSQDHMDLGLRIISHFHGDHQERYVRNKLWYYLHDYNVNHFLTLVRNPKTDEDFLGAYLFTMLECLHLLSPDKPTWWSRDTRVVINEVALYCKMLAQEKGAPLRLAFLKTLDRIRRKEQNLLPATRNEFLK